MSEPLRAEHQSAGHAFHAPVPGAPGSPAKPDHDDRHGHASSSDGVRDPVCGMTVDPHTTAHRQLLAGHAYYFCSAGCP